MAILVLKTKVVATGYAKRRVKATQALALSTIYFQGKLDRVNPPKTSGPFERILPGVSLTDGR